MCNTWSVTKVKSTLQIKRHWLTGIFFTIFTMLFTQYEEKHLGNKMSSEHFNTAGRNVGIGLTAAVIVSQWTWAATLLMSSNMCWRVGISGSGFACEMIMEVNELFNLKNE